ncbi:MAG TPA: NAD(P)-dependent oxidoreductase [Ktedonobacteraceae bacterium]|nr:NAD(P)-dependent oxidoreductase [Ktedonobacteraceae bacterium]
MSDPADRVLLATRAIEPRWQERLQRIAPELRLEVRPTTRFEDIPIEIWRQVEILYTYLPLPTLEQAPNLRWVQLYSAGADLVLKHPLMHTRVMVTTSSGLHAVNIAEYVIMMQLAWFHHLPRILEQKQKGEWASGAIRHSIFVAEESRGKTIGIVGYGSIGREVARLAKAFGMRVLAMQRSSDHRDRGFLFPGIGDPDGTLPDRYYTFEQLHTMLQECDVVVIAVPLTPQTTNLFDEAAFRAMKSSAFLINIARGEVCDTQALVQALQEKCIAGAALDVTNPEPLPSDHPLWKLPNVIISPHISGGTAHYDERALQIFEANLQRYLAGQPLYNLLDREAGY